MEKPKKIVVFAANGEIGEKTAHDIAAQMELSGNQVVVQLITRTGVVKDEKTGKTRPRPNIGAGIAKEVRENFVHVNKSNNADSSTKISMAQAFGPLGHPGHPMWDQSNPESLKEALKDADAIIVPAGVPRKLREDGTAPSRAELLGQNADAAVQIGEAIGRFSPSMTPVINCMNPADNAGTMIEEACRREWDKRGIPPEDRPTHKVITMGGSLDESRLRVFVAETVNKALAETSHNLEIYPCDIEGHVYGQHGPKMVIDRSSIRINNQSFDEFLTRHGLADKIAAIYAEVEKKTVNGGANLLAELDQTARFSPAKRMAEIAFAALFADKPHVVTAAVMHQEKSDTRAVASGMRVAISKKGIHIDAPDKEHLAGAIKASRQEIIADQAGYELITAMKSASVSLKGAKAQEEVTVEMRDTPREQVGKIARLIEEALKLPENSARVDDRGSPPKISFSPGNALAAFEKLSSAAKVEIQRSQLAV